MTNCKEALEYYSRKEREKRKLVYPAIYKHFKHIDGDETNNYLYTTLLISKPKELSKDEMLNAEEKIIAKFREYIISKMMNSFDCFCFLTESMNIINNDKKENMAKVNKSP